MRLSVLLRGSNFLEADRFGLSMDGRNNIDSLIEKLINPVREKDPEAQIFLATYDSPALEEIQAKIGNCETVLIDQEGSTQLETYKAGIRKVFETGNFDSLIASRFDLEFKKPFDSWNVQLDENAIYFPFREYRNHWRDHFRVGDAVHIVGKNALPLLHDAIIMSQLARRKHMHLLYYYLRTMHRDLRFMEDGYWDSNTIFANPECNNPLYHIHNRPHLAQHGVGGSEFLSEILA